MTHKPISSIFVLALTLSMSLGPASAVAQPPQAETSAPKRLWLETDTQALGERGLGMQPAVIRELRSAFEAEGVELVDEHQPDAVHVRLRFSGTAEDVRVFNYVLHFELIDGKTSTQLIDPIACPKCFAQTLYDTIGAKVPALLEAIEAETKPDPVGESTDITPPPGDGDGDGDSESDPVTPPPKPIGPVGISGVVIGGLGLGALIGGVVELSRGEVRNDDPTKLDSTLRDHTPPGRILVGVGAGALAVGVVMLGVDVGLRAKKRKEARRTSVLPVLGPNNAGLVLQGRF